MGSLEKEELSNYYAENTVFVAVGKNLKESESILSWVVRKFGGKKRICILHVHQPPQLVSFFAGKFTVSKFKQKAIKAVHETDLQKLQKLISEYVLLLSQMGVHADRMWIEMDSVEQGIIKMIVQHSIKWLVMGAAADKYYKKEMTELKSQKAIIVCEQAPVHCHIWFICRGNLICTRIGPGVDISLERQTLESNVTTRGLKRVNLDNSGAGAPTPQPLQPELVAGDVDLLRVGGDGANRLSQDSDVSVEESDSSALSNDRDEEESVSDGYDGDTDFLTQNKRGNETVTQRKDGIINEYKSPPRLTFRERGSILRACSVDFDSRADGCSMFSPSHDISSTHNFLQSEKEDIQIRGKQRIFNSRSSMDSALFEGIMENKARLQPPREIYDRLERAISDAENAKQLAFEESIQRWKAEEDALDATGKAVAAEMKCAEEMRQRSELEEALTEQKLECERFKEEYEDIERELPIIQAECSGLESQVRESERITEELEEKIILAVELLISFREKRDHLELERDKAVQEMKLFKRQKEQQDAVMSGPQFSSFSLVEIGEATCSFDPSKRIGGGMCGSIYQGILRHMEVVIRMLPNDGSQGQLMFERQVEMLSRVRHPHIVTLIGICAEAKSIIYEYLERGSLDDNLASSGSKCPLQWQTRVRIATEMCSALIFLHTRNPPVFHGHLKPTKILLDANFNSKIGDLGICHLIPRNHASNSNQHSVTVYTDPIFSETEQLTPASDVYSFGIILLQLLTGKSTPATVKHVRRALQNDKFELVLDFSAGEWPFKQAKSLARLALRCCLRNPSKRPDLATEVWSILEPLMKSCETLRSCLQYKENRRPPAHFLCPIFQEVMKDPCTAADGYTYEGEAIREWLDSGHTTSPMTNLELSTCDLIPNHALQYAIQEWLQRS